MTADPLVRARLNAAYFGKRCRYYIARRDVAMAVAMAMAAHRWYVIAKGL